MGGAAFDDWRVERGQRWKSQRNTAYSQGLLAWRRLLERQLKMPWEFTPSDL